MHMCIYLSCGARQRTKIGNSSCILYQFAFVCVRLCNSLVLCVSVLQRETESASERARATHTSRKREREDCISILHTHTHTHTHTHPHIKRRRGRESIYVLLIREMRHMSTRNGRVSKQQLHTYSALTQASAYCLFKRVLLPL